MSLESNTCYTPIITAIYPCSHSLSNSAGDPQIYGEKQVLIN